MRISLRIALVVVCAGFMQQPSALANGGAWQTGVPSTGNAAPSDKARTTNVAIEEENLTIDLGYTSAAVEVRYRMRNTGPAVTQDFFFPVELWTVAEGEEMGEKPGDLEGYKITADGADLKSTNVPSQEKGKATEDEQWGEFPPSRKLWKKSSIPFAANQVREVVIRYRTGYNGVESGVSDDSRTSDQVLLYSLSPAATWKGVIGKGNIVVNVRHPLPEEVQIEQPKERFRKVSDTRYEWSFTDLEPTLADDIRIIARRGEESYARGNAGGEGEGGAQPTVAYVVKGDRYFLEHSDYQPIASSTLKPIGKIEYNIANVASYEGDRAWCEGADSEGVGESITLEVRRPLPLEAIMIMPGYRSFEKPALWSKNNRVAEMEVTLNAERTFTVQIPDEPYDEPFPLIVRDYAEPVKSIKLVIKAVHRAANARDTCISAVRVRAKLAEKPEFTPAR